MLVRQTEYQIYDEEKIADDISGGSTQVDRSSELAHYPHLLYPIDAVSYSSTEEIFDATVAIHRVILIKEAVH